MTTTAAAAALLSPLWPARVHMPYGALLAPTAAGVTTTARGGPHEFRSGSRP